ncbi:hypothetical protein BWQ96_09101 [Gracilariopsis chorda]|uniref:Uncharacterized protein n=1 Tax=Gracilariopsis chorda TaxID=448386 RepID=A0A2V3IGF8_9FLOR|nr:hypothetical protein BWQ96_09101 [Gracilariopsis chorda]|eukprot:PXF41185.1 hypothetical protein BWQ96_09101 [Gracilariopsis chorda]
MSRTSVAIQKGVLDNPHEGFPTKKLRRVRICPIPEIIPDVDYDRLRDVDDCGSSVQKHVSESRGNSGLAARTSTGLESQKIDTNNNMHNRSDQKKRVKDEHTSSVDGPDLEEDEIMPGRAPSRNSVRAGNSEPSKHNSGQSSVQKECARNRTSDDWDWKCFARQMLSKGSMDRPLPRSIKKKHCTNHEQEDEERKSTKE